MPEGCAGVVWCRPRNSLTGVVTEGFREIFEARRSHLLPSNVNARNWRDYFCLGVNTSIEKLSGNQLADWGSTRRWSPFC